MQEFMLDWSNYYEKAGCMENLDVGEILQAQAKKLLKAISKEVKAFDGTTYVIPDYQKFKEAIKALEVK